MTPDNFHMVETIGRMALRRHPVWSHFESSVDRKRILGWGVAAEVLDREVRRYQSCGLPPLYPVLELGELPKTRDLVVAARFRSAKGHELDGYVIEPHAFGLFRGTAEFIFNRRLSAHSERTAEELAAGLGVALWELFPLDFTTGLIGPDGEPLEGRIEAYW